MVEIVLCLILLLICFFPVNRIVSNPETYQSSIKALDKKTTNVMELTAVTTAASVAITAIPGDTGTTVAEHLMDLNSVLMIVLIALFLEKYLLTIIGKAVFLVIIPLGLLIIILGIIKSDKHFILKSANIILTGFLLFAAIPAGVYLSNGVEKIYQFNLEEVIQSGEEAKTSTDDATNEMGETEEETEGGNIITDTWSKVTGTVSGAVTGAIDSVSGALEQGKDFLKSLTESLAILIVTSCVIPLLTVIFFLWLIKLCIGLDFSDKFLSLHSAISSSCKKIAKKKNSVTKTM